MTSATRQPRRQPTVTRNATPIVLPLCLAVFSVPEAIPDRLRSTLPRSAEVIAGTMSPRPSPSSAS